MVYKMLALNIDGTLLQENGRISRPTREAIEYAVSKGIAVTIATSQNFHAARRTAKALKLNTNIISNHGAYIASDIHKPVFVKRIHEQIASEICAFLEGFDCRIKLIHEQFSVGNKVKLPDNMVAKIVFQSSNRLIYSEQYVDSLSERLSGQPVAPLNIEAMFRSESDREDAKKALEEMYDEIACIRGEGLELFLTASGVSKLAGVQYLCGRLNISREEVVAIGSGFLDIPLVEWAGVGVAMGNSPDSLLKSADWITRTNQDNGVAYMVKEHFRKQHRLEFLKEMNVMKE